MQKIHVIWNPIAGAGNAKKVFFQVEARLKALNADFTHAMSEYPGHAVELTRQAVEQGKELIIAIGGDGTIREVAGQLVGGEIPLGIIPSGSGNDLVRALKIPNDPIAALDIALNGQVRKMDAGSANGEIFFNVAGFGFDVDVLDNTDRFKSRFGSNASYLLALITTIHKLCLRKAVIETEEGTLKKDVLILACGNGTHFGGGMNVAPEADPFDGKLDFCVISDVKKRNLPILLPKFMAGKHLPLKKHVVYFKGERIMVHCDPASRIQLDGEVMPGTPVELKVLPGVLPVKVS